MRSGLGASVTSSQTAAWADIDNDGYLDLFIGNENSPEQLVPNNELTVHLRKLHIGGNRSDSFHQRGHGGGL